MTTCMKKEFQTTLLMNLKGKITSSALNARNAITKKKKKKKKKKETKSEKTPQGV